VCVSSWHDGSLDLSKIISERGGVPPEDRRIVLDVFQCCGG